jgi:transcriptional regulator with XRE-family HTH domain
MGPMAKPPPLLGQRIRNIRLSLKIPLKDVAERARMQISTLSDIEQNAQEGMKVKYLLALARVFGMSVEELVEGAGLPAQIPHRQVLSDAEAKIIDHYRASNSKVRAKIAAYVSGLEDGVETRTTKKADSRPFPSAVAVRDQVKRKNS